ncbi:MAG: DNA modification methylase [Candidatus Pacebacteria bacterium]|nr:DNA modification methylase [Candidatus Paceibacterota bacterium]
MDKEKLFWKAEVRRVKDLKTWGENPRKISKADLIKLTDKIKQRGFHASLVIDTDNTILSGNQRKFALIRLKIEEVNVLVPNRELSLDEKRKIALESNINDGEWDFEKLKSFDLDLLSDIGFSDLDLSNVWSENLEAEDDKFDVESELAKIKIPKTKLGDLIIMGNHKLICGSATDPAVIKKLCGEEKISMIYSDPPFNISLDYSKGVGGKGKYGGNVNDSKSDSEYKEFLKKSLAIALSVSKKDLHVFYWSDQTYIWLIQELYREFGIDNKRVCLWIKNGQNPTPGVAFSKCYEPCTYGVLGKPYIAPNIQNLNEVMNKEITTGNSLLEETLDHLDIWTVKRLSGKDYEHATSKPPHLHDKAIRRCSKPGDIILDSFLGSGSTLIAAEQLKRRVFGTELEPLYCDLVIRRYEKLTGQKAEIVSA